MELIPSVAELARIRVLEPPGWRRPREWPPEVETVPADTAPLEHEIPLLHLGNNPHHLWLVSRLGAEAPVVVLHDTVLHHLLVELSAEEPDPQTALATALEEAHGRAGAALASARAVGHHGRLDPFLFPARLPLIRTARAVVVHSDWAVEQVRRDTPGTPVARIPLAAADPGPVDRWQIRRELGIDPEAVVVMHLGFLSEEKGIRDILTGVAAARAAGTDLRFVVVGEGKGQDDIGRVARDLGLGDTVALTGWVSPELFPRVPGAADLGVVLRTPSAGETSAAVLRFLACGVPVAVGAGHQFLEWPAEAAPRITPGPSAPADLARIFTEIGKEGWSARGKAARAHYETFHTPEIVARALVDSLGRL